MSSKGALEMRDSAIFYRSFYESIKELPTENQLEIYNAIFELSLNLKEVELSGLSKAIFTLIKPNIEANIKRYQNGTQPKNKQTGSKKKAKPKQEKSEPEANKDEDKDKDVNEDKGYISPIIPLLNVDPKAELQQMKKISEGSYQIWQMLAKEQKVEFTDEEWNAIRGLAMANPKLQAFQITAMLIQLHDWAHKGLDIKQAILDYAQKAPSRFNSLKQPFMKKVTDAKGNPIYGDAIVAQRKKIIEQERQNVA